MTTFISYTNMLELSSDYINGLDAVNKFGENQDIADGTTEEVWDGSAGYTFPTTADITHLSQDLADVPMQGATIEIQGLDSNWVLTTQTVALSTPTTTAVALTTPLIRVFRMKVLANVVAAQDISLKNSGGTTTYAIIQAGNNQTLMAIYTVPVDKTAYMTRYFASVVTSSVRDPKSTNIKLWTADRKNNYEFQIKHARGIPQDGAAIDNCFEPYYKISEMTDIKITGSPVDNPAFVNAGFDLILVDN